MPEGDVTFSEHLERPATKERQGFSLRVRARSSWKVPPNSKSDSQHKIRLHFLRAPVKTEQGAEVKKSRVFLPRLKMRSILKNGFAFAKDLQYLLSSPENNEREFGIAARGRKIMYVCICNAMTDRQVREAHKHGARNVAQVFRRTGTKPECGKCVCCMHEILKENQTLSSLEKAG